MKAPMNRADQRKYHYIYRTSRDDGRFYVGMHSTNNLDDGYLGSGELLWKSIKKHGKEKHTKEVLEFLPSRKELVEREKFLVNEVLLDDPLCMNIKQGGSGNSPRGHWKSEAMWEAISAKTKIRLANPDVRKQMSETMIEYWSKTENREAQSVLKKKQYKDPEVLKNVSEANKKIWANEDRRATRSVQKIEHWKDPEYKAKTIFAQNIGKQSDKFKEAQRVAKVGTKNPNFGTMWIHNDIIKQSKRIMKTESLEAGWATGRRMYNQAPSI